MVVLKYTIEDMKGTLNGVRVSFDISFLPKILKFESFPDYSSDIFSLFQKQIHGPSIQFYPTQEILPLQAETLKEYLDDTFKRIQWYKISTCLHQGTSFSDFYKTQVLNDLIAYKLIREKESDCEFEEGQLFIFYQNTKIKKQVVDTIKNFMDEKVLYSMQKILEKSKINEKKQDNYRARSTMVEEFLQFFVKVKKSSIQKVGEKFRLSIKNLTYHKKSQPSQPSWGLVLHITGNRFNMNEFFIELENLINSCKIELLQIQKIECPHEKIGQILPDSFKILNHKMLLVIDGENKHDRFDIICRLQTKRRLLGFETFSEQDLQILTGQWQRNELRLFLQNEKIKYRSIDFSKERVILQCDRRNLYRFKQQSKKFLSEYEKNIHVVQQFHNSFLIETFLQYYEEELQKKYMITFKKKNGKLEQTNYSKDEENIHYDISIILKEILANMVIIPSLVPIERTQCHHKRYIQNQNPQRLNREHMGSFKLLLHQKCEVFITSSFNFIDRNRTMIFLVSQDDLGSEDDFNSLESFQTCNKLIQLLGIEKVKSFIDGTSSKKGLRSLQKQIDNNFQFRNIVLFYIGRNIRKSYLEIEMKKLFHDHQKDEQIHIMINSLSQNLLNSNLQEFLKIMMEKYKDSLECSKIYLYYTQKYIFDGILKKMKKIKGLFGKETLNLVSKCSLNEWDIKRAQSLYYQKLNFFHEEKTKTLSGLASYIFYLELFENQNERYPLSLPISNDNTKYPIQLLVNLKENIVFQVQSFQHIFPHEPDLELKKFIAVISHYFKNAHYIVLYARNSSKSKLKYCYRLFIGKKDPRILEEIVINENQKIVKGSSRINYHLENIQELLFSYEFLVSKKDVDNVLEAIGKK